MTICSLTAKKSCPSTPTATRRLRSPVAALDPALAVTADTVAMARFLLPGLNRFKLDTVAKAVGVSLENHHRAVDDAGCTAEIFVKFVKMLEERNILTLDDLNAQGKVSEEAVRKLPSYHAIILAKNETGRVNLYRLVSESHLKYYNRRPKLPKSVYLKYQDGLMIGSACEAANSTRQSCAVNRMRRLRVSWTSTIIWKSSRSATTRS